MLEVWDGGWGIPSVDRRCLSVMAYCKFGKVPVKFTKTNNPWKSPTGELPVLRFGEDVEVEVTKIFNYLRKKNWGTDQNLTTKQSADIVAFIALVEEKLVPALLHLTWVQTQGYVQLTRPWYARALRFPLNYYMPGATRRQCEQRLRHYSGMEGLSEEQIEKRVYEDATDCLSLLSTKLGDQNYFFGRTPSSLDAVVFGCVAPLMKIPFPQNTLHNHLRGCQNLTKLCKNILESYFALTAGEEAALIEAPSSLSIVSYKKRDIVIVAVASLAVMAALAFYMGLVSIEVVDVTDGDDEEEQSERPHVPNFDQFDQFFEEEQKEEDTEE